MRTTIIRKLTIARSAMLLLGLTLALLFFSVGVEVGQLVFISAVLLFLTALSRIRIVFPSWAELVPAYGIGCIAMFWVIQRTISFVP